MRFVLAIFMSVLWGASAYAGPGQTYALDKDIQVRGTPAKMTFQTRPSSNVPQTIDGLNVQAMGSGLGHISAIALGPKGGILLADSRKGRIIRLDDRGQDGRIDAVRFIADSMVNPTSLAVSGETLYIADRNAIWQMPVEGGTRTILTSLQNARASDGPRVLIFDDETNSLILGYNAIISAVKIVRVDIETGQAELIAKGTGALTALAKPKKGPLWAGFNGALIPVTQGQNLNTALGQALEKGASIGAIIVPGQYDVFEGFPEVLGSHILAAQSGNTRMPAQSSGGFNVVAIPTVFGQPQAEMSVLIDGFLSSSGRSAWGYPAAMAMDARGLMIADPRSGHLWRLSQAPIVSIVKAAPPKPAVKPKTKPAPLRSTAPSSLGSRIEEGSQIGSASTLTLGSTIVRDYEKEKAEEAAAKEKEAAPN